MRLDHVWPKKMEVGEYRRVAYAGRPPDVRTLKGRIDRGEIPGTREGTTYYVWVNQALQLESAPDSRVLSEVSTGNATADRILAGYASRSHGRQSDAKSQYESA